MSENRASSKSSYQGDWETPKTHFEIINKEFNFTLDVAASPKNAKCRRFFTKADNALKQSWKTIPGYWWCNPDFRLGEQFLTKAWQQMMIGNFGIMLLPPNLETEWFRSGITGKGLRILHYPQRIPFINPEPINPATGKKWPGNTKGSILIAFSLEEALPKVAGQPWWQTI